MDGRASVYIHAVIRHVPECWKKHSQMLGSTRRFSDQTIGWFSTSKQADKKHE